MSVFLYSSMHLWSWNGGAFGFQRTTSRSRDMGILERFDGIIRVLDLGRR